MLQKLSPTPISIIPESSSLGGPEITQAVLKPYPRYGRDFFRNNVGNSVYHALYRVGRLPKALASYTFSSSSI
jgi:hypothetical protein